MRPRATSAVTVMPNPHSPRSFLASAPVGTPAGGLQGGFDRLPRGRCSFPVHLSSFGRRGWGNPAPPSLPGGTRSGANPRPPLRGELARGWDARGKAALRGVGSSRRSAGTTGWPSIARHVRDSTERRRARWVAVRRDRGITKVLRKAASAAAGMCRDRSVRTFLAFDRTSQPPPRLASPPPYRLDIPGGRRSFREEQTCTVPARRQ
jgi:hypothetical protein